MKKPTKHRASAPSHPLWMRLVAVVALVMAGVMGTAEAAHIHGEWLPHTRHEAHAALAHSQPGTSEEQCPICVAMHAALPQPLVLTHFVATLGDVLLPEHHVDARITRCWHFAMFSRPPPAAIV